MLVSLFSEIARINPVMCSTAAEGLAMVHEREIETEVGSARVWKSSGKSTEAKTLNITNIIVVVYMTLIGDKHHCCMCQINQTKPYTALRISRKSRCWSVLILTVFHTEIGDEMMIS